MSHLNHAGFKKGGGEFSKVQTEDRERKGTLSGTLSHRLGNLYGPTDRGLQGGRQDSPHISRHRTALRVHVPRASELLL